MNALIRLRLIPLMLFCMVMIPELLNGQFRNTYAHGFSEDHISLIKNRNGFGYIQASTSQQATQDVHLMKMDANGNVVIDKIFFSPTADEFALDVCIGNNNTYLVCGYEQVGSLDLGFVMSVDSSLNFLSKVYIQVPGNNKHTPALKVINSAFYEQNVPGNYWPGDPSQGYLVVGFEADGYGATQSKSAYAIKLTNGLTVQWARKFDSPISVGTADWDMCSNANWVWIAPFGYMIGGSGTAPTGEQAAMATLLSTSGTVIWSQLYSDNNSPGTFCVSADGAYDDAEFELYQLVNYSQTQSGGIIAFNQFTGAINMSRTRYLISPNNNYYTFEFGSSCASQEVFISGYGRNQTAGTVSGAFPFVLRYDKNNAVMSNWVPRFAYPTQSVTYNPTSTIFSMFSTPFQPRIFYPKHFAARVLNIWSVAGFEDNGTIPESHLIHPFFDGKDSCNYIDPQIQPIPLNIYTYPLNNAAASYVLPASTYNSNAIAYNVYSCCPADANFTYAQGPNCTYTFTATGPVTPCSGFVVMDISNNPIGYVAGSSMNFTFPQSGTYIVCYSACAMGNMGIPCRKETCQTITVTCPNPCSTMDADFAFVVNGCTVSFTDLTPDGNPFGCEYWTFGNLPPVFAGDVVSFTFPGTGTYTVCHTDCCFNSADGSFYYDTKCKQVTVNCTPPCCLPTNWTRTVNNCCVQFAPVWGNGVCALTNFFWNFGDGNVSNSSNPFHCYSGSGVYTVTLTAWCSKFQRITITKTIKVKCALPPPPPCCTGTSRIAFSTNGLLLQASDASTYYADVTPVSYEWNWGDGTSSNTEDAQHYYAQPGAYTVTHTVNFSTSTGETVTSTSSQQIVLNLSPPALLSMQNPLAFASSPVQCSSTGHSTSLQVVDMEGRAGMSYQWLQSSVSGGPYSEVSGATGNQCWVDNLNAPTYFVCRCVCDETGATSYSEEVALTNAQMDVTLTATPQNICVGASSTLNALSSLADAYEWYPMYVAGTTTTVSPVVTSSYEVFATNIEGCGALDSVQVILDPCVIPPNDSPESAVAVAYSSNMNYPNCYPIIGDHTFGSDSPESVGATGPDAWYRFIAKSTAVSITLNSPTADDMIQLYEKTGLVYNLMPGGSENAASGASDFERMNYEGLVVGNTYYISVGAASGSGGAYTLCIQHLMPSGCASAIPPGGFSLCGNYKALYRGSPSSGVTYNFNFTGTGGGAPLLTTSLTGTNGLIVLSSSALALRYGGIYNVTVDVTYNLSDGNGAAEQLSVSGSSSSSNCSGVNIIAQPLIEVKVDQRCPASLLRSNFLVGRPVSGQAWSCGVVSYTYEFEQIVSCINTTVFGSAVEYTTAGSSPFLPLGVLPSLPNVGAWKVRIRPNFPYGPGVYGPAQTISVSGTAASFMLPSVDDMVSSEKIHEQLSQASIYPVPSNGELLNVNITDVPGESVLIEVTDEIGRVVFCQSFSANENLNTIIVFDEALASGVYMVNMSCGNMKHTRRMIVQR